MFRSLWINSKSCYRNIDVIFILNKHLFIQCFRKVAVHLGYRTVQLKCDGTRWSTGGVVLKVAVHLQKVMEVMWCPRASIQAWTRLILFANVTEEQNPTRCHLLMYYACDRLNTFRAPLCPSSGAHDDSVGYHIGRLVLELLLVGN